MRLPSSGTRESLLSSIASTPLLFVKMTNILSKWESLDTQSQQWSEVHKQVLVGLNEKMVVGDHDFTKLTLTPSVNLLVKIPESMEETFYHGRVFVGLKREVLFKVHLLFGMQLN